MLKTYRHFTQLALTLIVGMALTGCGGEQNTSTQDQEPEKLLGEQNYSEQLRGEEARGFSFGSFSAPVTVHAFLDFSCQSCREFIRGPFSQLRENHIPNNKVRYIFYGVAQADSTPSGLSMQAALCADQEGVFWAYHDKLFQRQPRWLQRQDPRERLTEYAVQVGLNRAVMGECIEQGEGRSRIEALNQLAHQEIGVSSLPAVFINGHKLLDNTKLLEAIDRQLKAEQQTNTGQQ